MRRLAAHRLLPGEGGDVEFFPGQVLREGGGGGVAEGQPVPVRSDPITVRDPGAGGGAVPGEADIRLGPHRREIRQLAIGRRDHPRISELELLRGVRSPALSEALPDQHVDGTRPEHRPHRHLEGTGVGGRHDADAVIGRHAEEPRSAVDRVLELRLRLRGTVRATEEGPGSDGFRAPARTLGAGAGREFGAFRFDAGFVNGRHDGGFGMAHGQLRGQGEVIEPAPLALVRGRCPRIG